MLDEKQAYSHKMADSIFSKPITVKKVATSKKDIAWWKVQLAFVAFVGSLIIIDALHVSSHLLLDAVVIIVFYGFALWFLINNADKFDQESKRH